MYLPPPPPVTVYVADEEEMCMENLQVSYYRDRVAVIHDTQGVVVSVRIPGNQEEPEEPTQKKALPPGRFVGPKKRSSIGSNSGSPVAIPRL